MKDSKENRSCLRVVLSGRRRINAEDEGRRMRSMCFVYVYEKRTVKSVKIIL
jgi:hypothetical protein